MTGTQKCYILFLNFWVSQLADNLLMCEVSNLQCMEDFTNAVTALNLAHFRWNLSRPESCKSNLICMCDSITSRFRKKTNIKLHVTTLSSSQWNEKYDIKKHQHTAKKMVTFRSVHNHTSHFSINLSIRKSSGLRLIALCLLAHYVLWNPKPFRHSNQAFSEDKTLPMSLSVFMVPKWKDKNAVNKLLSLSQHKWNREDIYHHRYE